MATATIETGNVPAIIGKIADIREQVGAIKKEGKGGVPYAFRGVDQVTSAVVPALNAHRVIAVPSVVEHNLEHRLTGGTEKNGVVVGQKLLSISRITLDVTFYAEEDGSSITARVVGEAQDYSDKSSAQAHSVALRIAFLQTFTLPTDSPDPDENQVKPGGVEDVVGTRPDGKPENNAQPTVAELQKKIKDWAADGEVAGADGVLTSFEAIDANTVGDRIAKEHEVKGNWKTNVKVLAEVIAEIEKGVRK